MKGRTDAPPALATSKCKRIVRPLISKLHSLTGLYTKHPDKFRFDLDYFEATYSNPHDFSSPDSARDRLNLLKPFLSVEVFEAYVELFNIFRSIVASLYPELHSKPKDKATYAKKVADPNELLPLSDTGKLPRLSHLAATKLGKSIALGTKTSYFSLSQTILFDPTSIPRYLQKYHNTLADDIDDWLEMEPAALFSTYRPVLVLGYVFHILVLNLAELLFTLLPVLVHWLHEEKLPWLRGLFMDYWLLLKRDPDHMETYELKLCNASTEPNLDVFWLFNRIGYWRLMVDLLRVSSCFSSLVRFDPYSSLLLDVLGFTDRMDMEHIGADEVCNLLIANPQYPCNTTILISVMVQLITTTRQSYSQLRSSTEALDLFNATYRRIRQLVHTWLGLRNECVFNSLDRGNEELFHGIVLLLTFSVQKSHDIFAHLRGSSMFLCDKFDRLSMRIQYLDCSVRILYAFYMDESLHMAPEPAIARYLFDLVKPSHGETMLITFTNWLHAQDQVPDLFLTEFYETIASRV